MSSTITCQWGVTCCGNFHCLVTACAFAAVRACETIVSASGALLGSGREASCGRAHVWSSFSATVDCRGGGWMGGLLLVRHDAPLVADLSARSMMLLPVSRLESARLASQSMVESRWALLSVAEGVAPRRVANLREAGGECTCMDQADLGAKVTPRGVDSTKASIMGLLACNQAGIEHLFFIALTCKHIGFAAMGACCGEGVHRKTSFLLVCGVPRGPARAKEAKRRRYRATLELAVSPRPPCWSLGSVSGTSHEPQVACAH